MYFIIQLTICSINEIYVAAAQVKCSLTGSDNDSNRIPIQLEGTSNTHQDTPGEGCSGHLWYNLGITGSTDGASLRATLCQVIGTLTPLGLTPMSPSTSLLPPRYDLPFDSWPELYYSDLRSERLIWPTKC
jgi:hypothetical protein